MGKFVVKTTANGGFKFDLKAGNGEIIASSQIYKSEKSCNAGIESVRNNCTAEVEDQTVEPLPRATRRRLPPSTASRALRRTLPTRMSLNSKRKQSII